MNPAAALLPASGIPRFVVVTVGNMLSMAVCGCSFVIVINDFIKIYNLNSITFVFDSTN